MTPPQVKKIFYENGAQQISDDAIEEVRVSINKLLSIVAQRCTRNVYFRRKSRVRKKDIKSAMDDIVKW